MEQYCYNLEKTFFLQVSQSPNWLRDMPCGFSLVGILELDKLTNSIDHHHSILLLLYFPISKYISLLLTFLSFVDCHPGIFFSARLGV